MPSQKNYRLDIQGLRAIAVLAVFLFHLEPRVVSGGFVGVDVFFVISGYLISGIILHKKSQQTFGFLDFYVGRFKRLLPVYLCFLIVTLVVSAFVYLPPDMLTVRDTIVWASAFLSNIHLAGLDNYFGASSQENPLLHTWTLSIEMQFYFLLPALLIWVKNKHQRWVFTLITVLLFGYSFVGGTFLQSKGAMYFSLLARMPEFLLGVLCYINEEKIKKYTYRYREILSWTGILLIILSCIFFSEEINFPGLWVLVPCLALFPILVHTDTGVSRMLSQKLFVHIGEISYSVYLWHWAMMAMMRYALDRLSFTILEMLIITVATYGVSYLSYRFVENSFRKTQNTRFYISMALPVAVLGFLSIKGIEYNKSLLRIPIEYIAPSFGLDSHGKTFEEVQYFGDTQKPNDSILLIGDSNALVYKNFFDKLGKEKGFNFRTLTNDIYPNIPYIAEEEIFSKRLQAQYENILKHTFPEVEKAKTIIFISAYSKEVPSIVPALEKWREALGAKKNIVFVSTFPLVSDNPIRNNRGIHKKPNKPNNYGIYYKHMPQEIVHMVEKYPNVHWIQIDFENWKGVELPFKNNISLYYDQRHLNMYGTDELRKDFGESVYQQLNQAIRLHKEK